MDRSPRGPVLADVAPNAGVLTRYDERHLVTYLRLLDADAAKVDWRDVARLVLNLDPDKDADGAHKTWASHLARAHWMTESGYRHLLQGGAPK